MRRWIVISLVLLSIGSVRGAGGPPVDLDAHRPAELVAIASIEPGIRLDLRYATKNNFTGRVLYSQARAFLQRPAAEALARVHRRLAGEGFGIVVLDAYRPWRVTRELWDATPPDRREFVADPAVGSRHNRGAAVDVMLYDLATGRPVAMPSEYDEMSERSAPGYPGGDAGARGNRDRLRRAMEREGFFVYPVEWWHFDWKDWRDYPVLDLPFGKVAEAPASTGPIDLREARIIDLTHPFDARTLYWPSAASGFQLQRLAHGMTAAGFFYSANAFAAPEHGGTHIDAPIHFARGGWTLDAIPPERLVGPAIVLDVRRAVSADRDYRATPGDVRRFEQRFGRIPRGAIVFLRTGWDAYWPDRARVFGDDTPGRTTQLHFPAYGRAAAEFLIREREVAAIGLDTPSLDHGPSTDFPVHRVASEANVYGLENVANLEQLPEAGAWVAALPMKIAGGSGGPLRIVAFLPR